MSAPAAPPCSASFGHFVFAEASLAQEHLRVFYFSVDSDFASQFLLYVLSNKSLALVPYFT